MKFAIDGTTLHARDGSLGAGIERYTREIVEGLTHLAPDRVQVIAPVGRIPLVSRHLLLPLTARSRGCRVLFAPSGQLPLGWMGKSVITIHDVAIYEHPEWFSELGRQDFSVRVSVPRSIEQADHIIAVSEATRQALERRFPIAKGKTTVIYEGVSSPTKIVPLNAQARERFELKEDTLLFVGTLEPRKNVETAVRAFDLFLRAHPDRAAHTRLVLAGKRGWNAKGIEQEIARVNAVWKAQGKGEVVRSLGFVTDEEKWSLYATASAFLFPSWDEGFGLPLLEAFAAGTPVLASDRGALPEVGGDAAVYIAPDNVEQWSLAIAQCLFMPDAMQEMIEQGTKRAAQFSWDRAATETLQVITALTSRVSDGRLEA